ncbi:oxidoreductase [[Mycobacterium] kokjensenii]|uniref:Oxidoreductase n=1 Tax=[Mycobacterium] kokjensenii TaxID=3064287 RepID=A0ABM9L7B4_9MYCO|nr:oxidoreductase [Mycolicibacter sp. MU0083]CAJ1493840.1 oxidoreductase [Mycolicibacter sp. MU0083]
MSFSIADAPDQSGRTFVVTGANGGLGEVVTRTLAAKGATVVMACRNAAKAQQVADGIDGDVQVAELDLASLASVRDFAAKQGGFDVLVNNAGIMNIPMRRTVDGFETQFGVNHLGHFALTGLLLDRITDRVVTVASIAHKQTPKFWIDDLNYDNRFYQRNLAYAQSKLANLMFARELQRRLVAAGSPLRSYAVHPGVSNTYLFDNDKTPIGLIYKYGLPLLGQPPERGAESTVYAASVADADPAIYWGPTKLGESRGPMGRCPSSKLSKDQNLWRRLWEESEKMTGVSYPL